MMEAFFGFKKTPFCDRPDPKELFPSQAWNQAKARLQFLADHHSWHRHFSTGGVL